MASIDNIRAIARALPCFEQIESGKVTDKCSEYSRQLRNALQNAGVPTIMVGGDMQSGNHEHHYLYCKTDDGIKLVDPTAAQYVSALTGDVYIGSRQEVIAAAVQQHGDSRNWNEVWSGKPMLWMQHNQRLSPAEKTLFNHEWRSVGIQINDPAKVPIR